MIALFVLSGYLVGAALVYYLLVRLVEIDTGLAAVSATIWPVVLLFMAGLCFIETFD